MSNKIALIRSPNVAILSATGEVLFLIGRQNEMKPAKASALLYCTYHNRSTETAQEHVAEVLSAWLLQLW